MELFKSHKAIKNQGRQTGIRKSEHCAQEMFFCCSVKRNTEYFKNQSIILQHYNICREVISHWIDPDKTG